MHSFDRFGALGHQSAGVSDHAARRLQNNLMKIAGRSQLYEERSNTPYGPYEKYYEGVSDFLVGLCPLMSGILTAPLDPAEEVLMPGYKVTKMHDLFFWAGAE